MDPYAKRLSVPYVQESGLSVQLEMLGTGEISPRDRAHWLLSS